MAAAIGLGANGLVGKSLEIITLELLESKGSKRDAGRQGPAGRGRQGRT